jgi:hypothetical protein
MYKCHWKGQGKRRKLVKQRKANLKYNKHNVVKEKRIFRDIRGSGKTIIVAEPDMQRQ